MPCIGPITPKQNAFVLEILCYSLFVMERDAKHIYIKLPKYILKWHESHKLRDKKLNRKNLFKDKKWHVESQLVWEEIELLGYLISDGDIE